MSNYYEETMPLETDNDDYLKYFFDESIPLFQRLNTIIKKGDPIQKQALLSKLVLYQSTDLFKSLMEYILNEIGTWDKETITLFPRYLYPLFKTSRENLIKSIDNELFNLILKKFILTISSTEEHISREYMIYFEKIIEHFNEEKNEKNESFPYSIEESIFNDIISLGKFDETLLNKQLSCCLCCSFIRLINDVKNKNVQNLFNRVCFLFSYCEKEIETQLSRELEFLFPIFKQNLLENSDISRSVDSYLSRDSDFVLQSITIISILRNLHLIKYCELIEKLIGKIKEIFTDEGNFEQGNKNRIFLELIKSLEKNYKKMDIKILKKLFEDNFISNFIINNKEQNIIIENFDVIVFIFDHMVNELTVNKNLVLEESNFEITNKEEKEKEKEKENTNKKLYYDDLFVGIYNHYLNIDRTNNYYTQRNQIDNQDENLDRKILYNNLLKILPYLSNFKKNRYLFEKVNTLFNSDNILFVLNCYSENFNISPEDNNKKTNNMLYNLMYFCLKKNIEGQKFSHRPSNLKSLSPTKKDCFNINQESYYLKLFNNILSNILNAYNIAPNSFNNNIHLLFCDFLQKIIKKIYKYLKPLMRELNNYMSNNLILGNSNRIKIKSTDKIFEEIFLNYLIKAINNEHLGNHIRNEIIKVFPYLILYGNNRVTYFKYIQEHFIQSKKYFFRRYSIVYLEKCLEIFSFKMFNKIGLSDFLIMLINDENNAISANIINLIYMYNKKLTKNSSLMFQNIIKNLAKINKDNKDNKLVHIEDFDIEKNRIINNVLSLDLNSKDNNDKNEEWVNLENKLIKKEKEIFGDDPFYGFHHLKSLVRSQTLNLNSQSLDMKTMNRKNSYLNNMIVNKEIIIVKNKEKINMNKKILAKDKFSSSSTIITNHSNSKNFLPKIRQNRNSCINSFSTKIIVRPNVKKLNNFKLKQENQKFLENNSKNNNSMILNEKSSMKSSYDFAKKGKSEQKAIKLPHSMTSVCPELLNNINAINLKSETLFIESNKIRLERRNNKDMLINTIYKNKNSFIFEYNAKNNKTKLKKDNLRDNTGRYGKIICKINADFEKINTTNASLKEKTGQYKWFIK